MANRFGMSRNDMLSGLQQQLPQFVDRLTPDGRLPTEDELSKTKSFIVGSFPGDRETPQQVAGDLWLIESQGLPRDYFEQLLRNVAETSRDACTQLVKQRVHPEQMIVVVVGPASVIGPQLESIAPVTIVPPEPVGEPVDEADGDD